MYFQFESIDTDGCILAVPWNGLQQMPGDGSFEGVSVNELLSGHEGWISRRRGRRQKSLLRLDFSRRSYLDDLDLNPLPFLGL